MFKIFQGKTGGDTDSSSAKNKENVVDEDQELALENVLWPLVPAWNVLHCTLLQGLSMMRQKFS